MKKKWLILTTASVGALGLLLLIAFIGQGPLFYQALPGKFKLNIKFFSTYPSFRSNFFDFSCSINKKLLAQSKGQRHTVLRLYNLSKQKSNYLMISS